MSPEPSGNTFLANRENNIGLIRLLAALSVTFAHSFAMSDSNGKFGYFYGIDTGRLAHYAVLVFFILSGFLVTESWHRKPSALSFCLARSLRIFPGLALANLVTVIAVVFLSHYLDTSFGYENLIRQHFLYFRSAMIFQTGHYTQVFRNLPYHTANGSLWTLPLELMCYMGVLTLGTIGVFKYRQISFVVLGSILFFWFGAKVFGQIDIVVQFLSSLTSHNTTWMLVLGFIIGVCASLKKSSIKLSPVTAGLSLIIFFWNDDFFIKIIMLSYFLLVFALHPSLYFKKLNFTDDLSYGIYVMSWPIQQTLLLAGFAKEPIPLFFMTSAVVLPLALFSWRFIETPALRWHKALVS